MAPRSSANETSTGSRAEAQLNQLYLNIIQKVCKDIEPEAFRYVLGAIVCAKRPFTQPGLDTFLGLGQSLISVFDGQDEFRIELSSSDSIIYSLGSILQVEPMGLQSGSIIRILHPSLRDFFLSPTRCTDPRFYICAASQNAIMVSRCFAVMFALLKRNMCNLDPTKYHTEIPDLKERISVAIPEHLSYACQSWMSHLSPSKVHNTETLYKSMKIWLFVHLLHWLEVMSLIEKVDDAVGILRSAQKWFEMFPSSKTDGTLEMLTDALRFIELFDNPIRNSAAHIYISALPFTPTNSLIAKTFVPKTAHIPRVVTGISTTWPASVFQGRGPHTLSPSNSYFLSYDSSNSRNLRVHDFNTGALVGFPLVGHMAEVTFAECTKDGAFITTMAADATVRIWDAATGTCIGGPFGPVDYLGWSVKPTALLLSPDGSRVVASYGRNTLQIWDTGSGLSLMKYDGEEGRTLGCPCISEDGKYIFNAWEDCVVIFKTDTGTVHCKYGLEPPVDRIRFSSDTRLLICGENVILDAWTGMLKGKCHGECTFSPEGTRILSFSESVIRIYDSTALLELASFHAENCSDHYWLQHYVAVMSSSMIVTINTLDGTLMGPILQMHSSLSLLDLQWSSDGKCIITLDTGRNIRFWDVLTGRCNIYGTVPTSGSPYGMKIAVSPNFKRLLTHDYRDLVVWDLNSLSKSSFQSKEGATRSILSVHTAEASSLIVVTNQDNLHRVWNTDSGIVVQDIITQEPATVSAYSSDGKYFAIGHSDGHITLEFINTNMEANMHLRGHTASVTAAAFSPSCTKLASVSDDRTVRIWNLQNGLEDYVISTRFRSLAFVAFSSDELSIVGVAHNSAVAVYDMKDGTVRLLQQSGFPSTSILGDLGPNFLDFYSPKRWIAGHQNTGHVFSLDLLGNFQIWKPSAGTLTLSHSLKMQEGCLVCEATFSADTTRVFSFIQASSLYVHSIGTATTKLLTGHYGDIVAFQFSADSTKIATVSEDATMCVWDTDSAAILTQSYDWHTGIKSFSFSPDGTKICSLDDNELWLWDTGTGKTIWRTSQQTWTQSGVRFSIDGTRIVIEGSRDSVFDAIDGTPRSDNHGDSSPLYHPVTYTMNNSEATSPDNKKQARLIKHQLLCILDTGTLTTSLHPLTVMSTTYHFPTLSLDEKQIAVVTDRNKICIWDVGSGIRLGKNFEFDCYAITSLSFWKVSSIVFTFVKKDLDVEADEWYDYQDNPVYLAVWDFQAGTFLLDRFGDTRLWDPVLFADGSHLVMHNGSRRGSVKVWNVQSGAEVLSLGATPTYLGHERFNPKNTAFSVDGRKFVHVNSYGSLLVWDLKSGQYLGHGILHDYAGGLESVCFAHGSDKIIQTTIDGDIMVWDFSDHLNPRVTYNYPPNRMMIRNRGDRSLSTGWFYGDNGERLLWIPPLQRGIWAALPTGKLIISDKSSDPVIVDLSEYVTSMSVAGSWRKGGVSLRRPLVFRDTNPLASLERALIDHRL